MMSEKQLLLFHRETDYSHTVECFYCFLPLKQRQSEDGADWTSRLRFYSLLAQIVLTVWFCQVSGSLQFAVYYDQLQSRLVVTVLQVEGLLDASQAASLQLFVKLRLMWAGSEGAALDGLGEQKVMQRISFRLSVVPAPLW